MSTVNSKGSEMTLADHAEAWWRGTGRAVPGRETPEWHEMYKRWHGFAFADFPETLPAGTPAEGGRSTR